MIMFNLLTMKKTNWTINANSGTHVLTYDKIVKDPFNKSNVTTIKSKQNSKSEIIITTFPVGKVVVI